MASSIRTRKFLTNRLLGRKQFIIDVLHPSKPNVSIADLQKELADKYRAKANCIFIFGLKTHFGGGKSTGFGLIYDNEAKAKEGEPKYRLARVSQPASCASVPAVKAGVARNVALRCTDVLAVR
jgi:small subunit ribosomal protein S24e